ncbi:MAG: hypothetical protein AAF649_00290 [Verrucomicrobiota bacterium]
MRAKDIFFFTAASIALALALYGKAFVGLSILAPVDIAPALFKHYEYMDHDSSGIPDNHYIIDQLTYDLPLQQLIYQSYRSGEVPWWNPYGFSGRPLLADAHINGTDPVRLIAYHLFPFVPAYNLTKIFHGILTGLGMFLLLRSFKIGFIMALLVGLTYQISGCFTSFFGHPWIQATTLWFPYIWILWNRMEQAWTNNKLNHSIASIAGAAILCSLVFYSGNLQSHTYIVVFALLWLVSRLGIPYKQWLIFMVGIGASGFLGALVALPILVPCLELYAHSIRDINTDSSIINYLAGPGSIVTVFPWAFGTFRTIDLGKLIESNGLGFAIYIGSALSLIAILHLVTVLKCWAKPKVNVNGADLKCAGLLFITYVLVLSTPLAFILYMRMAPLAVMGLTVLGATAFHEIIKGEWRNRRVGVLIIVGTALLVLAINIGALAVYPHVKDMIMQRALSGEVETVIPGAANLRKFQVNNFAEEVSIFNYETVFAAISLIALGFCFIYHWEQKCLRHILIGLVLLLNFVPLCSFHKRFVPNHEVSMWESLKRGGPMQNQIREVAAGGLRVWDDAEPFTEKVFPNSMQSLYRIHTIHGYAALQPPGLFRSPGVKPRELWERYSDIIVRDGAVIVKPEAEKGITNRFQSTFPSRIKSEKSNSIEVIFDNKVTEFTTLNTPYPGWKLANPVGQSDYVKEVEDGYKKSFSVPESNAVKLEYRPSGSKYSMTISVLSLMGLLAIITWTTLCSGKYNLVNRLTSFN